MSAPVLTACGLRYTYPDGTEALRGVDLSLARGERVGLIGPNGSGKSTLLLCLSGLLPAEGTLRVEALPGAANQNGLRSQVGLVFQSPDDQLFMPTLRDDLAFGPINQALPAEQVEARVARIAEAMNLTALLDRAPHHLSMGQKRNAAIAAVLAMQPSVLLLDEPSSNLDPRARRQLMHVLEPLDATLLIASHDLALVGSLCARVALIDEGRIVAEGGTRALLSDAALMEAHGLESWNG
jgi:energy-coupling factor transporter ATP-binding protein EcfA2